MADASIPIQPASPASAAAPVGIRTVTVLDANGNIVQIQCVALLDGQGKIVDPLTEATGQLIVQALRELHSAFVAASGGVPPTY